MADPVVKKKSSIFKFPHACAFLFMVAIIITGMTYIIPAGSYERAPVTLESGKTQIRVIPNSYEHVEPNPQPVWSIVPSMVKGFNQSAAMVFMMFFCGAAVFILEKTGTVNVLFQRMVRRVAGREHYAVFIIMLLLSIGGATGALSNTTLALIPLGMVLSRALGYDKAMGFFMIYLGSFAGFNVGWSNVFTVGIAHGIAELPEFSGFYVRVFFHVVNFALTYAFIAYYGKSIKQDHTKSLNYDPDLDPKEYMGIVNSDDDKIEEITINHILCTIVTVATFGFIIYGALSWGWSIAQFSACFIAMSIFCGLFGGLGVSGTADNFIKGCASMTLGAFVVGVARAISVIMSEGKIMDSIVFYLSSAITDFGPVMGANMMFFMNVIINFLIPSGSGQAVVVMPLMVPIADLVGITRQVAVQAYQFGDGLSNCIIPTSGVLMSALAMVSVTYSRYIRWFTPFFIVQIVLACIALTVLQLMNWQ